MFEVHSPEELKDALGDPWNGILIVGIDPGVTTGYSILALQGGVSLKHIKVRLRGQLSYGGSGRAEDVVFDAEDPLVEAKLAKRLVNTIAECAPQGPIFIAIEDFIVRRFDASRQFLSPVRITASIMSELLRHDEDGGDLGLNDVHVYLQAPSDAKKTCNDERMDKWGFTINNQKERHSRDAERHSCLLLRKLMANPRQMHLSL